MINSIISNDIVQCFSTDLFFYMSRDYEVFISSVSGSIIFIVIAKDFTRARRITLFVTSMMAGVVLSGFIASMISLLLGNFMNINIDVPDSVGAIISSAGVVRALIFFCAEPKSNKSIFDCFRKSGRG